MRTACPLGLWLFEDDYYAIPEDERLAPLEHAWAKLTGAKRLSVVAAGTPIDGAQILGDGGVVCCSLAGHSVVMNVRGMSDDTSATKLAAAAELN